jgi:hypothetical protein
MKDVLMGGRSGSPSVVAMPSPGIASVSQKGYQEVDQTSIQGNK